jgi:hypothetical protein
MPHAQRCGNSGRDVSTVALVYAEWAFCALGTLQLILALILGRSAMAVDGLHNLGDGLWLELLRRIRVLKVGGRGGKIWRCRVEPLTPAMGAVVAVAGTLGLWRLGVSASNSSRGAGLSLAVELLSVALNGYFAWKLHHLVEPHDSHSKLAEFHLWGDVGASLAAAGAYIAILAGGNPAGWDIVGAKVGFWAIVAAHIVPCAKSVLSLFSHIGPHSHEDYHGHHDH